MPDAISLVRDHRAGARLSPQSKPLAGMLQDLEPDELMWLDMVLCVRVQQSGRAGRRGADCGICLSRFRPVLSMTLSL